MTHSEEPRHNTYAAWPSTHGIAPFTELILTCIGTVDPTTGYVINIHSLDEATRKVALPILTPAYHPTHNTAQPLAPTEVLAILLSAIQNQITIKIVSLKWQLTPYYGLTMHTDTPHRVLLEQQFEFAAAHRLHCPQFSTEENRRIFGKCNNLHGHGHNYKIQPAVSIPADSSDFTLQTLEKIVHEIIIQRFDHTHLNLDHDLFYDLNPSVENLTRICFDLLQNPIKQAGGTLEKISIWETEKTKCTYPIH